MCLSKVYLYYFIGMYITIVLSYSNSCMFCCLPHIYKGIFILHIYIVVTSLYPLKSISQDHLVPQLLQVPQIALGPSSSSLVPIRTVHTRICKLIETAISNFLDYKGRTLGDQLLDHKQNHSHK